MKEAIAPVMSVVANGTSVTYSYSPSLQACPDSLSISPSDRPALSTHEESLFLRHGDYWTIRYQGHVTFLKATRGLQYLALLLRDPGREFHVSELLGQVVGRPLVLFRGGHATDTQQGGLLSDVGPILDAQAKAEYKHRLDDLGRDLEEAEQFNDSSRAERARSEIDALAEQLASAIGLGGRNRKVGADAERARSAVTKRIKSSIKRIGKAIPSLGSHLAALKRAGACARANRSARTEIPCASRHCLFMGNGTLDWWLLQTAERAAYRRALATVGNYHGSATIRAIKARRERDNSNLTSAVLSLYAEIARQRVKTGCFCSYDPQSERSVAWKS